MSDENKLMDLVGQYGDLRVSRVLRHISIIEYEDGKDIIEAEIRQMFRARGEVKLTNEHGDVLTMPFATAIVLLNEQLAELKADRGVIRST